jgi:TetR/AcrR family transcriptional regulator, transcriptional repressor for nem operon
MEDAIEGAMQIFWEKGYGATNLPDLLEAMMLTKGSFYKAFGDKRSIYLEALKRYDRLHIGAAAAMLQDTNTRNGKSRLLALFRDNLNGNTPREERRGCLMCNAMVELGPNDAEVAHLTAKMYARIQQSVFVALKDSIPPPPLSDDNLTQQSVIITNMYFGAQALSKSGQTPPDWSELLTAITG